MPNDPRLFPPPLDDRMFPLFGVVIDSVAAMHYWALKWSHLAYEKSGRSTNGHFKFFVEVRALGRLTH